MLTFGLLISIWMGGAEYKFQVYSDRLYRTDEKCEAAAAEASERIIAETEALEGARGKVVRWCYRAHTAEV